MSTVAWHVAQVLETGSGRVRVRFERPRFCERCQRGQGCGAGVFSRLFPRRSTEVVIKTSLAPAIGDWVRIGIPGSALALTALFVYGLPVFAFVLGALPAHWWIESPLWRDLLSLAGGVVLALVTWRVGRRFDPRQLNPVVEPLSCASIATKSQQTRIHQ
jgi:sigma-E factor negative regulatory protein RseC